MVGKRIIAFFTCFVIIISSASFASAEDRIFAPVGYWDMLCMGIAKWADGFALEGIFQTLMTNFTDAVCAVSPDNYHHYNTPANVGGGREGLAYTCDYCGEVFVFPYSDVAEVLEDTYDDYVAELPATGITSSGNIIWCPTLDSLYKGGLTAFSMTGFSSRDVSDIPFSRVFPDGVSLSYKFDSSANAVSGTYYMQFDLISPVSGAYRVLPDEYSFICGLTENGEKIRVDLEPQSSSFQYFSGDSLMHFSCTASDFLLTELISLSFFLRFPVYEIIPDSVMDIISGDTYNINSRPTSITGGNYGIIGDDGTITTITDNSSIVNETNNTYYNPATGETSTITDWSYDYSDRSYKLTLEGGDTTTVTYGDEKITIIENTSTSEGDTIVNTYYVYYMLEDAGGNNPTPSACPHDWQQTSSVDPTCTAPGKVEYTCSKCGETKTETVPALGHDWKALRTVPTEYDEDGNLIQEGYTLYECTRCGEQYKDENGTGPPGEDDSGNTDIVESVDGFLATIQGMFGSIAKFYEG